MNIVKIIVPQTKLFALDYIAPEEACEGDIVIVPFRNDKTIGIIYKTHIESTAKTLKNIIGFLEPPGRLDSSILSFIAKASEYYLAELGSIGKLVLPVNLAEGKIKTVTQDMNNIELPTLSIEQTEALGKISKSGVSVLHGITGSGKTELYFYLIKKCVEEGKQAIFLLPEIALSKQIISRFEERFNTSAIVWNSSITPTKKRHILSSIISGDAKIIIGARSALFLPYKKLGLIIIDEEHDSSYKQDDGILYNARDMAVLRGHLSNIPVVLGSATPSTESFYNINSGKYTEVVLKSRFGNAQLPYVKPIDMRKSSPGKNAWISKELKDAIRETLSKGEQILLFLNRKGYSPLIVCNICGYKASCSSCSSSLVFHKSTNKLICHHCGYHTKLITNCPECHTEASMIPCGPGVERIQEEVANYFPEARIQLMTREDLHHHKEAAAIIENIMKGNIDIIIGTQIITKGYHFPKLTTVGVIDTDIGLSGGDLRSSERTFQLIYQVGGRAGREDSKGTIFLQTFSPNSNFIKLLQHHDYNGFMKYELEMRNASHMPPITRMASIIFSDKNEILAKKTAIKILNILPETEGVTILGPVPALLSKIKNKYRYRLLIIAHRKQNIQQYLSYAISHLDPKLASTIKVDIDPYNFY